MLNADDIPICCGKEMELYDGVFHCECGEGLSLNTWLEDGRPDRRDDQMFRKIYGKFIQWLVLNTFPDCVCCQNKGATCSWGADPICKECYTSILEVEMNEYADNERWMLQ